MFGALVNTAKCTWIGRDILALRTWGTDSRTWLSSYPYRARQKLPLIEPNFSRAGLQSVRKSQSSSAELSVLTQCERPGHLHRPQDERGRLVRRSSAMQRIFLIRSREKASTRHYAAVSCSPITYWNPSLTGRCASTTARGAQSFPASGRESD